jgi:hypothetical protein
VHTAGCARCSAEAVGTRVGRRATLPGGLQDVFKTRLLNFLGPKAKDCFTNWKLVYFGKT